MAASGVVRTVAVRSPSAWRETKSVLLALFHITLWSGVAIYLTLPDDPSAASSRTAVTYDLLAFKDLPPEEQRIYRMCLEGLGDAETARAHGEWPTIDALVARNLPPFVDRIGGTAYTWTLLRDGALTNYVGTPVAGSGKPAFAIILLEPEKGMAPDPQTTEDETHHRLADGTMIHVGIWTAGQPITAAVMTPRYEEGWRRITQQPL